MRQTGHELHRRRRVGRRSTRRSAQVRVDVMLRLGQAVRQPLRVRRIRRRGSRRYPNVFLWTADRKDVALLTSDGSLVAAFNGHTYLALMRPRGRIRRASDWQRWFNCIVVLVLVSHHNLHLVLGVFVRRPCHVPMAERGWGRGNRLFVDLLVVEVLLVIAFAKGSITFFTRLSWLLGPVNGGGVEINNN